MGFSFHRHVSGSVKGEDGVQYAPAAIFTSAGGEMATGGEGRHRTFLDEANWSAATPAW
ncbi:hypothetical protein ACFFVA_09235 [Arthrobacter psychrochitiniphilus]